MTWSLDNTGYKYPALSQKFQLLGPELPESKVFYPSFLTPLFFLPFHFFFCFGASEISLIHFQIVSEPQFNCILPKIFRDISKFCPSRNSLRSYRNCFKTFPICVPAEFHHQHHAGCTTQRRFTPQSTYQYSHPTSVFVSCNFCLF